MTQEPRAVARSARALHEHVAIVLDFDGTIVDGGTALPGAVDAVDAILASGRGVAVVTNNSFMDDEGLAGRLAKLGFAIPIEHVHTSVDATASAAARLAPGGRALVLGPAGLRRALELRGMRIVEHAPDIVVTTVDRELTYERLTEATRALFAGVPFVANNVDRFFTADGGIWPGGGTIAAALEYATGRAPDEVLGKPSTGVLERALDSLGAAVDEAIMVGDNRETDIRVASALGMTSILVRTGAARLQPAPDGAGDPATEPTAVLDSMREVAHAVTAGAANDGRTEEDRDG